MREIKEMKEWKICYGTYRGAEKQAVNLMSALMEQYTGRVPSVMAAASVSEECPMENVVVLGTPEDNPWVKRHCENPCNGHKEGYVIDIRSTEAGNTLMIAGNTGAGVLYGAADLIAKYLPEKAITSEKAPNLNSPGMFSTPFCQPMPEFHRESAPAFRQRGIWTWGHCIFDYRKFFRNMSLLKLNEIVLWNDFLPVNAAEVVEYAHSLGIRVIWGFAWGWDVDCKSFCIRDAFDPEKVHAFGQKILAYLQKEILPSGADGIYFQSFTELTTDTLDGVNIAQAVTAWVNGVAAEIYAEYPEMEIQFGLHASSVKEHLDYMKEVDKRIQIIWEDCGAFPYAYSPEAIENDEETQALTKEITVLRGPDEAFGAVLKGMTTLYWPEFQHLKGAFVLGESTEKTVDAVAAERTASWKYFQAKWMKNAEYFRKTAALIADATQGKANMQMLVEFGAFEKQIPFPAAFAAEAFWSPELSSEELKEMVALSPFVKFSNL